MFKTKRSKLKEVELALETLQSDLDALSTRSMMLAMQNLGDKERFQFFQGERAAFSTIREGVTDILFDIVYD